MPRITAAGGVSLCCYIDHLPGAAVSLGFARAHQQAKRVRQMARARACLVPCAYRVPCPAHACPSVTIVACPALAYRVRLRVRVRACRVCARALCVRVRPCASPACVPARARVRAYGGERVREVGLLPSRMLPKFDFGYSPTAYSGISARIAALSALQATMEASFWRAASANSPLVRTAARSARGQSIRSDAGTPTSLMRSTI